MQSSGNANGPERQTDWTTVDWRKADRIVRNLRHRIFRAAQANDLRRVRSLQKLMLRSYSNILLGVRRVTQINAGKYTPGVDNLLEVQAELDRIFPRWYDRDWQESDALGASRTAPDLAPSFRSVRETVFEYLETELADHPDREAVLALAGEILAEEDRP